MKKFASFLILLAFSTACKKKPYNCACSTNMIFPSGNHYNFASNTKKLEGKLNKKQASALCDREEAAINETFQDLFTENGSHNAGGFSSSTSCKVIE